MEYVNCVVDELGIPMYLVPYLEQRGCLDDATKKAAIIL